MESNPSSNTPETTLEQTNARVFAGIMLSLIAGSVSASFDKLATWFLAGFGAALALTLSQLKDATIFIPTNALASTVHFFIYASVLCLVQRYIATCVGCGVTGAKDATKYAKKFPRFDVAEYIIQMKAGLPLPVRLISRRIMDSEANGDFAGTGRLLLWFTMIQGLFVTGEIALLLFALWNIANKIKAKG